MQPLDPSIHDTREHRRRRLRRHGRRAYIRSVYLLPSLATLGNAVCGFGAMYVATLDETNVGTDKVALWFLSWKFLAACYLILLAMVFDALDGRLARFARHTTDFGGQLDSLADVVSFGAAPAFIALMVFKEQGPIVPFAFSRLNWAIAALYFSCAAIRLARFNVSNEHGEQHHFSFLGLPSPGAAAAVVGFILMQQELYEWWSTTGSRFAGALLRAAMYLLFPVVAANGLLMVSNFRYPHLVNKYLRGKRSFGRLLLMLGILLGLIFQHRYFIGLGSVLYALSVPVHYAYHRIHARGLSAVPSAS